MWNKVWGWLAASNRYKHLAGGFVLGLLSPGAYAAALTVGAVASALEFKDRSWGGKWDWTDWAVTVAGGAVGYGLRALAGLMV